MTADLFSETLRNLRAHWLRVLLTGSGILWGIALFITLTAAGNGMQEHYAEKMAAIGRRVIYTFPGVVDKGHGHDRSTRAVVLDRDDPPRLPGSPRIDRAAGEVWSGPRVLKGGGRIKVVWTYGVGPDSGSIRNFTVDRGRFLTPDDERRRRRVLVLGAKVEKRLFGRRSALGRSVRLEGIPFRVVGISAPKGEQLVNLGPRDDEQVLMPLSVAQALFTGSDRIHHMIHEPPDRASGADSIQRVRTTIGRHHHFAPHDQEALSFFNITDAMQLTETIGLALQVFNIGCGLMTLIAGGIGVMNIMLVAVAERTREIGLRKAVGATNRLIISGIVAESVVLTIIAGLVGLLLGGSIIAILRALRAASTDAQLLMPSVRLSPQLALLAFVVLVAVGILAAIVPARRAAALDPAVALRQE